MQTKFNYTNGGEFLRPNGIALSGYFNIDENGNAYTGKYFNENSETLESISEYSADYHRSEHFKDRYVFDVMTLPYTLDEILIQPNEFVTFNVLNTKIRYLHENLIYMYSKMFMGSTDVPVDQNVTTLCCVTGTSALAWASKNSTLNYKFGTLSSVRNLSAYSEFDKIKKMVIIPFVDNTGISVVGITDTHLIALTSSKSSTNILGNPEFKLYTNVIDNYSQETCKNLEDIAFDGRYLYVSDSAINSGGQVFKYDATAYYTNDDVFEGNRFLIEPIGGYGSVDKINKFNGCTTLGVKPNELWVYDSKNNVIKIFDPNFVWKKTVRIRDLGGTYKILDIRHRILNDHMYVLYERPELKVDTIVNVYGLFEYDENHILVANYVFEDILYESTDKKFNRIVISEQDSNVFYAITNSSIYKKFFTKPEKSFAVFDRSKFYPKNTSVLQINDIDIVGSDQNYDDLYFVGPSYISRLQEKTDYLTVLREINLPYYNYERIKFEGVEYNQGIVLNKEMFKLFANIIQFKNTLKGRFYAEFNDYGDLMYKDYIYLSDDEINTLNIELEYNTFINDNELVQPNVINRLFKKVYEFQLNLLSLTNVKLKNLKTWVDLQYGTNIYPIS